MSFPRYPAYRPSGVEWIGDVPSGWKVTRVSEIAKVINGVPFDSELFDPVQGMPLVRIRDLGSQQTESRYRGDVIDSAIITSDDVLIGMDGDFNVGRWEGRGDALLNQRMCCIRSKPDIMRFLQFALPIPLKLINDVTYSTTVKHLSSNQVRAIKVALPAANHELEALVKFVASGTAGIDALISEQERLIGLLGEKRQALISKAVTKGLDPAVPMKDSGIEWLGNVPKHWEVRKLSSVITKITNGFVGPTRGLFVSHGVPYIQSLHVKENKIGFNNDYFVTREWSERHEKSILSLNDVVIVQTGDIGQSALVTEEFVGANCHALIVVSPSCDQLIGPWLAWTLNSPYGRHSLLSIQTGALHPHLNCVNVKDISIPVPSTDEQKQIVTAIGARLKECDRLTNQAMYAIALLRERRFALISAAVTGKIDVRGLAPALQEAAE